MGSQGQVLIKKGTNQETISFEVKNPIICIMHHCRMEGLITQQYGSFTALSKLAKEDAQQMGCLKRVMERALWGQLYLDKLRMTCLGWSTACHQEWGLFLLEHLPHNVVAMQKREREWHARRCPPHITNGQPERWPLNTPLSGPSWDLQTKKFRRWQNECTMGSMCLLQVNSLKGGKKIIWPSCMMSWDSIWLEVACRKHQPKLNLLSEVGYNLVAAPHHQFNLLQVNLEVRQQPSD